MKFYLSSYKTGNKAYQLKELCGDDNKTAYIPNASDAYDPAQVQPIIDADLTELRQAGLDPDVVDLKQYFGKSSELKTTLNKYGVIWVKGGNTFVLRQAMKLSGLDIILEAMWVARVNKLYGGYSAGICVLCPSLKGVHLVDDPDAKPYGAEHETIWNGLGIISYHYVPHYRSDHPESAAADKCVDYYIEHKMLFKALRDGEVIIKK